VTADYFTPLCLRCYECAVIVHINNDGVEAANGCLLLSNHCSSAACSHQPVAVSMTSCAQHTLNQLCPLNDLSTYALSTARHASKNSSCSLVTACAGSASEPRATDAAVAAAAKPRPTCDVYVSKFQTQASRAIAAQCDTMTDEW
jgi:hypothetical protein